FPHVSDRRRIPELARSGRNGQHPLLGPVGPVLLLPDRHDVLECIDEPAAGFECLVAVGTTDCDHDTDIPQVEMADSVNHGRLDYGPAAPGLSFEFGQLLSGHLGVGLVVEGQSTSIARQLADRTEERTYGARTIRAYPFRERCMVDRAVGDLDHRAILGEW